MSSIISPSGKEYFITVGLEIHAELNCRTKMFCACKNDPFDSDPNTNICPVCTAQPGALPVPNLEAIKKVVQVGLAVKGEIADFTEFDRKNYFYPDIPKGYQISQYKYPIVTDGELAGVKLTRIHLEEDTGTSSHEGDVSLLDFNRAGVALMELVTEPVIHDAETAIKFGQELQLLLRRLNVSNANMEQGEMRVEVNVSISPDKNKLGTKVEVKNIASFSMAGKAIDYEAHRMMELWEEGKQDEIVQETRGWDDVAGVTKSQRSKEEAKDYRYFPEPNIPKFYLHKLFDLEKMKEEMEELPSEQRERYKTQFGIKEADIEFFVYNKVFAHLFERTCFLLSEKDNEKEIVQKLSNFIITDISGLVSEFKDEEKVLVSMTPENLRDLVIMFSAGELSSRAAKDILRILAEEGGHTREIAESRGLIQKNDDEFLLHVVLNVIANNQSVVDEYKKGKETVVMFLVGQCMKESKGAGNPGKFTEILKTELAK